MSNNPHLSELLSDHLQIRVAIDFPHFMVGGEYDLWAQTLLEQDGWSVDMEAMEQDILSRDEQLLLVSFLQMIRLLCTLGNLPLFDLPRVKSFSRSTNQSEKSDLQLELQQLQFMPPLAYQIPVKAALELCRWMSQHRPTSENISKVFGWIAEKVIKPLHRIVPAGKSTIPVLRVAHRLGIPYTHLGLGVYQVGWGSKARKIDRSVCDLDSAIGSKLSQNKATTAHVLRMAGLPAPVHAVVTKEAEALSVALKIGLPVVIKPTDQDRGEGVTVDVSEELELKAAFAHAQKLSKSKEVIVERQVSGVCHRLFVAHGELLYAVKRLPMSVMGDGERAVWQLVDDEITQEVQKAPWKRSPIRPLDDLAREVLKKNGWGPDTVPDKGVWVPLRRIESTQWGGIDEEVTEVIHPENQRIAREAADLFGLNVAGIDIISPDISKPWYVNGAVINEVNFAPLLGGAEISRSHIPKFFAKFIEGDGKISIEIFDDEQAALEAQKEQVALGYRCHVTTSTRTLDECGNELIMPLQGLKQRVRALILRKDVDSICAVVFPGSKPSRR